mmetsp:Transcript_14353/g.49951  ORF Transcript_14353/g.49951 Transcript_14353/m.49951 type:complete len:214 (-) Transcript_14353:98-739(-)
MLVVVAVHVSTAVSVPHKVRRDEAARHAFKGQFVIHLARGHFWLRPRSAVSSDEDTTPAASQPRPSRRLQSVEPLADVQGPRRGRVPLIKFPVARLAPELQRRQTFKVVDREADSAEAFVGDEPDRDGDVCVFLLEAVQSAADVHGPADEVFEHVFPVQLRRRPPFDQAAPVQEEPLHRRALREVDGLDEGRAGGAPGGLVEAPCASQSRAHP